MIWILRSRQRETGIPLCCIILCVILFCAPANPDWTVVPVHTFGRLLMGCSLRVRTLFKNESKDMQHFEHTGSCLRFTEVVSHSIFLLRLFSVLTDITPVLHV